MSLATVEVLITETGEPCRIATREFFVYVLECCNGKVLQYCKKTFSHMKTECGRLEFEIPPGCYIVGAVVTPAADTSKTLGNHLTHIAVVRVNCGDHVCVTLFDSSLHVCGNWLGAAINTHVANPRWRRELGGEAIEAMQNAAMAVERMLKLIPADPISETTRVLATKPRQGGATEITPKATKGGAKKSRK